MVDASLQRKPFITGLIEVIGQGIGQERLDDAEAVVLALRVLRPKMLELDTFDAWIAIKRGYWPEAVRILRNIDAQANNWHLGKALLAFCQFAMGDSAWTIPANEVMDTGQSPEAVGLVKLLINQRVDDDDEPEATPAAASPMNSFADPSYLRV
jgi:type III secretion protein HrpB1